MSNFQINDIIQISCATVVSQNLTVLTAHGYGKVSNIDDATIIVDWSYKKEYNNVLNINDINNSKFESLNNVVILKKINDNDWIDKDGNHYDNNGVKL